MCIWFGYNPQMFCQFIRILNLIIFQARLLSKWIDSGYLVCAIDSGYLVCATPSRLLQFYADLFETLEVVWSGSENVQMVYIHYSDYILSLYLHFEISHFFRLEYWHKSIDCGYMYLVYATPPAVLCRSFWNVKDVFNTQIIIVTFSAFWSEWFFRFKYYQNMSPVKRICVFEHSVMTNFNCACPAIQRGQGSGFLSEGSSWLTACMSEQRRFWRDCADAQARLNLRCSHRR